MSTETATDIAALVGEMEAPECGHSQHSTSPELHSQEPASHYVRTSCPGCPSMVYPACPLWVRIVGGDRTFGCGACGSVGTTSEFFTILGPVTK